MEAAGTTSRTSFRGDRYAAFKDVTLAERAARHDRRAAERADAMDARRALADAYLAEHADTLVVPDDRGIATACWIDETRAARAEAASLAAGRTAAVDNGALEFPVLGHEVPVDGAVLALATSPPVVAPITRYLGFVPILFNLFVTRAHTTEILPTTAHLFHLDPEDMRSMKLFVHLTDVDEESGPLHVIPSVASERILDEVGYTGIEKIGDERMAELGGWEDVVQVLGPAGTIALADTTRCLHFGGRPRAAGQPVREMLVVQYLLPTSVIVSEEGGRLQKSFIPQLQPTGDRFKDALAGFGDV